MACKICNEKVKKNAAALQCDFCLHWFHCSCVGLSEDHYEHFKELGTLSFWFCKADKKRVDDFIKKGKADDSILSEMKAGFDELKNEVSKITGVLENKIEESSRKSFAEVLRINNSVSENKVCFSRSKVDNGVVVVPKSQELRSRDVERLVKEKVNLVSIKTGVSKIKHISNSGIYLATSSDVEILQKEISSKLGEDFKVFKPKEPTPQLIISGLSREYSADELWLEIKETNPGFNSDDSIKVVHHRKNRYGETREMWSYVLETSPATFKKLLNRYISIDFKDHYVKQYVEATRCYNCQQYNHKSSTCSSPAVCCRCGRNHKTSDCARGVSFSCINCKDANLKGARFNTNHSCGSNNCSVHQHILKAKQSRIDLSKFLQC